MCGGFGFLYVYRFASLRGRWRFHFHMLRSFLESIHNLVYPDALNPERCLSGLKSTPGKCVYALKRTEGSNPSLSDIQKINPVF